MSGFYAHCHSSIIGLDPRHKIRNILGKFLTNMQSNLPVLGWINPGNDLIQIIAHHRVGHECTDQSVESLKRLVGGLVDDIKVDSNIHIFRHAAKSSPLGFLRLRLSCTKLPYQQPAKLS